MYAVVRTGGKQYCVESGTVLDVETLSGNPGDSIELSDVLLVSADGKTTVGTPAVSGASVQAEIVQHKRGPKLIAFKKTRRHGTQRKVGHRQNLTRIRVTGVSA